jgi:hypothetical protein
MSTTALVRIEIQAVSGLQVIVPAADFGILPEDWQSLDPLAIATLARLGPLDGMPLLVDLAQVDEINTPLLGLLLRCWRFVDQFEGSLHLCGVNSSKAELLRLMAVDTLWECSPDRESAVWSFHPLAPSAEPVFPSDDE